MAGKFSEGIMRQAVLQSSYYQSKHIVQMVEQFNQSSKYLGRLLNFTGTNRGVELMDTRQNVNVELEAMLAEAKAIVKEYEELEERLNLGNLRKLINNRILEKGYIDRLLASELGFEMDEITRLRNGGDVSLDLLVAALDYFKIDADGMFENYQQPK